MKVREKFYVPDNMSFLLILGIKLIGTLNQKMIFLQKYNMIIL